ncbi:MAG: Dolichyl-phosphate-mannose-protein mannosyltransferase [Gaiellaceae bacterium]|nr:Dolichyl-phosphate-mannose-protein mannosyltransferase [Gaiellaceae bacterium]
MALDLAAREAARPQELALLRLAAVPARFVLAGIVATSLCARFLLALAHATPLYLPDEYIYSSLARGIAETGRPVIRGSSPHFPALLEPILASPFWIFGDPELAYRLTQGLHALAMSLAAVPVYLLCRRLGLGKWFALGAGLFTLVSPDLFYVSFVLAEPIAYPLALAAIYLAVRVLDEPTRRTQVALVAACGLATFARIQYVVLPAAFVLAALLVERGDVRRIVSRLRVSLGLLAAPALLALGLGPGRVLGYYSGISRLQTDPGRIAHWLATDSMLLAYASGCVLVPGALVGLAFALVRPAARVERAFAAVAAAVGAGLLAETALYASNAQTLAHFQERYLLCVIPLAAPLFGLYVKRGAPARGAVALLAVALVAISARFPLSGYTDSTGRQDSPFLLGVSKLETAIGTANGSLVVAGLIAGLALAAAALAFRPRMAGLAAIGLSVAFLGTVDAGAFSLDQEVARHARDTYLPADPSWVDHSGLEDVTVIQTPGAPRPLALEQLFWNKSITQLVRLRRTEALDAFAEPRALIDRDGSLLVRGVPLDRPLLVTRFAVVTQFANAVRVARTPVFDLWRPVGVPRLSLFAGGRFYDGWLASSGYVRLWPDASGRVRGTLRLPLALPRRVKTTRIRFTAPGVDRVLVLRPGRTTTVRFAVSARQPWTLRFKALSGGGYLSDGRSVSARAGEPAFERR